MNLVKVKVPFFFAKISLKNKKFRKARLHLRKTHNNIFVTLTDSLDKVIATMSGGCCFFGNKRAKVAPQVLESIIEKLVATFKKYRLNYFEIWLKSPFSWHVQILLQQLYMRNLSVVGIIDRRIIAHNGVRGRKLRRV